MPTQAAATAKPDLSLSLRRPDQALTSTLPRVPVSESTEIELRFHIPARLVDEITSGQDCTRIEQHYFPRRAVPDLVEAFNLRDRVDSADDFTVARLRRVESPSGLVEYALQFKGDKERVDGARVRRREFEVPIKHRVFLALKSGATNGSLVKRRYDIAGELLCEPAAPVILQVDVVEQAGRPLRKLSRVFCTGDIEVGDIALIKAIRSGNHTFSFLTSCIELSGRSHNLSNSKVARRGLDSRQRKTVEHFSKQSAKAMRSFGVGS